MVIFQKIQEILKELLVDEEKGRGDIEDDLDPEELLRNAEDASLNFGCRPPLSFWERPPHDVEALCLGTIPMDSKPTYQAKQKLDRGLSSSNKGMDTQQSSVRLLSSLLSKIDFVNRNQSVCMLCEEMKEADVTVVDRVCTKPDLPLVELWRGTQHSCTDLTWAASPVTARKAIKKKKDLCIAFLPLKEGTTTNSAEINYIDISELSILMYGGSLIPELVI